jgi:soluble lytic murein transglycosylase
VSAQRSAYRSGARGTHGRTRGGRSRAGRAGPSPARSLLRALVATGVVVALVAVVVTRVQHDRSSGGLPLTDASVIREQAADKHLDPALIAAVIYAETKFEPRTSATGALGLMQLEPQTAEYIARLSGGYRFTTEDLATPRINVAYGSWYLRYLLDHYGGEEMLAVAAYNAGVANVDSWIAAARAQDNDLSVAAIPFPETRAYVERVLRAQREYRSVYPRALGLR